MPPQVDKSMVYKCKIMISIILVKWDDSNFTWRYAPGHNKGLGIISKYTSTVLIHKQRLNYQYNK
ncbi:MAG: hypothetical protein JWR05_645 [Mucilaginibacter sp.]|nr:hypothetical protein [Mucilaginibacter sp.]